MAVDIAGVRFKNPVLTASGTFGYGLEFANLMDLNSIGGIVVKGLSMTPIKGNPPPRIYETASGMLNAIGWQNIGATEFVTKKLPALRNYDTNIIVNIVGFELNEYLEVTRFLNDCPGIKALELNISCPNVHKGGFHFNKDPRDTFTITAETKKASPRLPLWVKLSPNVTDIREFARACEDAGADALSVVNTFIGMAIDVEKRRPRLRFRTGGLSGPAIKPIALRMVWEACQAVKTAGHRHRRHCQHGGRAGIPHRGRPRRAGRHRKFLSPRRVPAHRARVAGILPVAPYRRHQRNHREPSHL